MSLFESLCCCYIPSLTQEEIVVDQPKPQTEETSQAGTEPQDEKKSETVGIYPAGTEPQDKEKSETGREPKNKSPFQPGQDEDALSPFLKWIKSQTTFKEARGESWKAIKHNGKNLLGLHKEPGTSFHPEECHAPVKSYTQKQSQQQARY